MIITNLVKIMMFLSSYFPLYIMILIIYFEKYFDICTNPTIRKSLFLFAVITAIVISIFSFILLCKSSGDRELTFQKVERPDDTIISYIMTYIIPLLSIDITKNSTIIVNFLLFIVIGYLYIRLNLVYLNPLWAIFGYVSYRIDEDKILITNIPYNNLKRKKVVYGYYLVNSIFVAKLKNN
nr:MAG TPA: hypothetical protein [Caudoviricetes sp.]